MHQNDLYDSVKTASLGKISPMGLELDTKLLSVNLIAVFLNFNISKLVEV